MAKKNTAAIAIVSLGVLGAGGAAAVVLLSKKDKATDIVPPGDKAHKVLGEPYRAGFEHAKANAWIACTSKPQQHPAGVSRGSHKLADWLTWVAFLETWPKGPIKFENSTDRWATEWRRIYTFVFACLKAQQTGKTKKSHTTMGHPYRPGRANEKHNAITAVQLKPTSHPAGPERSGKPLDGWLATYAYLETNPTGPVTIKAPNDNWARSWKRIRAHVREALKDPGKKKKKKKDVGKEDPKDKRFPVIGGKFRLGAGNQRHNALVAVDLRPTYHPRKRQQGSNPIDVWLTTVAYYETTDRGPTVIKSPNSAYGRLWNEIRVHVRRALAKKKKKKTKDPITPPKTLGPPWKPGRANEKSNAVLAVTRKPAAHPNGERRTAKHSDVAWFTNLAYWESWYRCPIKLKSTTGPCPKAWKRIRGYVVKAIAGQKKKTKDPIKDPIIPPKKQKRTFGAPFEVAQSKKNAVLAVSRKPTSHPNGQRRGSKRGDIWYTNIAFWETVGEKHPVRITKSDPYFGVHSDLWKKIRVNVQALLKKQKTTPGTTPGSDKQKKVPHGLKPASKIPSLAHERANVKIAAAVQPTDYPPNPAPYNMWGASKADQAWFDWLANVVLWGTYPDSPIKLGGSQRDKKYVKAWVRIRKHIGRLTPPAPARPTRSRPAAKRPGASPAEPSAKASIATGKADKASATEMRNAAIVVASQPRSYERTSQRYKRGTKLSDWYSNVAYWSSFPEGPGTLSKRAVDKPYVAAWIRINRHVKQMLALRRKLPGSNPTGVKGANADQQWLQWALAMRVSSNLKTPRALTSGFTKGAAYLLKTEPGRAVTSAIGQKAGPFTVTLSGLIAEAAIRVPGGKLSTVSQWKRSPTRSFWVATSLF